MVEAEASSQACTKVVPEVVLVDREEPTGHPHQYRRLWRRRREPVEEVTTGLRRLPEAPEAIRCGRRTLFKGGIPGDQVVELEPQAKRFVALALAEAEAGPISTALAALVELAETVAEAEELAALESPAEQVETVVVDTLQ